MSSAFRRTLPARPNLDQQKKLAKELFRDFRDGDARAIARMRAELPDKTTLSLADAQFVVAREYGFASWRALREQIESITLKARPPLDQLKYAMHSGDLAEMRRLLEKHIDLRAALNEPKFGFESPALVAAAGGSIELVNVLLEFGADPNRRSNWWAGPFHPLHVARGAVAERLLAAGSIPDACGAANIDRPDLLAQLLAENPARVHERGGDGQTPLHFARSRQVVDLLLDAGADLDARDADHRSTPAQWMLGDGPDARVDLARYLVERGAEADIFLAAALGLTDRVHDMLAKNAALLDLRTSQGEYAERKPSSFHIYQWTIGPNLAPMQVAAKFGRADTLAAMESFASPEQRLMLACHRGDAATAHAVTDANPGIVTRLAPVDRRAFADEAWEGNTAAVELMLSLGFDPLVAGGQDGKGGTALHNAAWQGYADCVAAILRHPASKAMLTMRDGEFNSTPAHWCVHGSVNRRNPAGDYPAILRMLFDAGAPLEPSLLDFDDAPAELMELIAAVAARSS